MVGSGVAGRKARINGLFPGCVSSSYAICAGNALVGGGLAGAHSVIKNNQANSI